MLKTIRKTNNSTHISKTHSCKNPAAHFVLSLLPSDEWCEAALLPKNAYMAIHLFFVSYTKRNYTNCFGDRVGMSVSPLSRSIRICQYVVVTHPSAFELKVRAVCSSMKEFRNCPKIGRLAAFADGHRVRTLETWAYFCPISIYIKY